MKKIMNADSDVVEEMLSGYLSAYSRCRIIGMEFCLKTEERIRFPC